MTTRGRSGSQARPTPKHVTAASPPARTSTRSLPLGEYKLPATGSFPAPPKIPSLGPTTGAPLSAALAWCADISAIEAECTAEIVRHTAELARHAATLGALDIRCCASWAGLFDVLGYGLLSDSGTPVEPSAYIQAGRRVSAVPRGPEPRPSLGKGKGKERAVESEDGDEDEDAEPESGSGGMNFE